MLFQLSNRYVDFCMIPNQFTMKDKIFTPLILILILTVQATCQESGLLNIQGKVTDTHGESLIGVNVQVKGTTHGTATDLEGAYTLEDVSDDAILVFSYIGYQTLEEEVEGRSQIDVTLTSDAELLEEIVVVGYGRQKKANVVGRSEERRVGKECRSWWAPSP